MTYPHDQFDLICGAIRYMADGLSNSDVERILSHIDENGWQLVRKPAIKNEWFPTNDSGTAWFYGPPGSDIDHAAVYLSFAIEKGVGLCWRWRAVRRLGPLKGDYARGAETEVFETMWAAAQWCLL